MYPSVHSDTPVAKTIISNNIDRHEALLVCILYRPCLFILVTTWSSFGIYTVSFPVSSSSSRHEALLICIFSRSLSLHPPHGMEFFWYVFCLVPCLFIVDLVMWQESWYMCSICLYISRVVELDNRSMLVSPVRIMVLSQVLLIEDKTESIFPIKLFYLSFFFYVCFELLKFCNICVGVVVNSHLFFLHR